MQMFLKTLFKVSFCFANINRIAPVTRIFIYNTTEKRSRKSVFELEIIAQTVAGFKDDIELAVRERFLHEFDKGGSEG